MYGTKIKYPGRGVNMESLIQKFKVQFFSSYGSYTVVLLGKLLPYKLFFFFKSSPEDRVIDFREGEKERDWGGREMSK